ncbi:hypothetical protein [Desulfobulbus propionicus]|uniref:hypothetical protein n=1 Tax=Desulfobulbus propionicus TaxID=894 RepID=UPI00146B20FE|nr:hypothetical protein [Desulfobulbus propionicus]
MSGSHSVHVEHVSRNDRPGADAHHTTPFRECLVKIAADDALGAGEQKADSFGLGLEIAAAVGQIHRPIRKYAGIAEGKTVSPHMVICPQIMGTK